MKSFKLKEKELENVSRLAGKNVARALSKLSNITFKEEYTIDLIPAAELPTLIEEKGLIITYQQLTKKDIWGISLFTLTQQDALALVDMLNNRGVGTTKVLSELDKSALKEACNILSNSFMNSLSKYIKFEVDFNPPSLVTKNKLTLMIKALVASHQEDVVLFGLELSSGAEKTEVTLIMLFDKKIYELMSEK